MRPGGQLALALTFPLLLASGIFAVCLGQTNERAYESLQWRVVTPGARAVAMGKTFVGIADDATAAASNPAGLSNLLHPEASMEFFGTEFLSTRFSPTPTNPLNTLSFSSQLAFPSFASFVTPLPGRLQNATLAGFYNSLQEYKETFQLPSREVPLPDRIAREDGHYGDMRMQARAVGISGAYVVNQKLSIGGSLAYHHLKFDSETHSGAPPTPRNGTITHDADGALNGQLGILVKPTDWISVGAALHPGTTFSLDTRLVGVFAPENSPPLPAVPIELIRSPDARIEYRIPTRFTIGAAARLEPFTFVLDVGYIRYSERITTSFLIVDFLNQQQSAQFKPCDRPHYCDYYFNDVVELHVGAEYRFVVGGRVYALRGGAFTDPDHAMRFNLADSSKSDQAIGQAFRFNSLAPTTAIGVTAGGGIVLGNRFQLDGAVSISESQRDIVLSFVTRFPR